MAFNGEGQLRIACKVLRLRLQCSSVGTVDVKAIRAKIDRRRSAYSGFEMALRAGLRRGVRRPASVRALGPLRVRISWRRRQNLWRLFRASG